MAKRHSEAVVLYGGVRPSFYAQKVSWEPTRPVVDSSTVEDRANRTEKGPQQGKMGWDGFATSEADYEREVLALQAADNNPKPFSVLWGASPVEGDPANFSIGKVYTAGRTFDRGKMAAFKADLNADGEVYTGVTMWNTLFGAGLGPGTFTSPPQQLGALAAGFRLVANFHLTDPPGFAGVPPVGATVTLQSATTLAFTSPVDRASFVYAINTTADLDGRQVVLDGDATPVTDTYWAWKIVITGLAALLWPAAVGGVWPKNT